MIDNEISAQIGDQYANDVRGWLVFHGGLPDELQRAEDATQAADHAYQRQTGRTRWSRPVTATEKLLLEYLFEREMPEDLQTRVEYITDSLRRRRWLALEAQLLNGEIP